MFSRGVLWDQSAEVSTNCVGIGEDKVEARILALLSRQALRTCQNLLVLARRYGALGTSSRFCFNPYIPRRKTKSLKRASGRSGSNSGSSFIKKAKGARSSRILPTDVIAESVSFSAICTCAKALG